MFFYECGFASMFWDFKRSVHLEEKNWLKMILLWSFCEFWKSENCKKSAISFGSSLDWNTFYTFFSRFIQSSFLASKSQSKAQSLYGIEFLENHYFYSVRRIFNGRKFLKNANNFDFSRSWKSSFSLATGLISSLFNVTSSQDVPFLQPLQLQCSYHGSIEAYLCSPFFSPLPISKNSHSK